MLVRDVDALPPGTSLRHPERSALRHDHPTIIRTTRAVLRVALLVLRERRGQSHRAGQAVHLAFLEKQAQLKHSVRRLELQLSAAT